MDGSDDSDQAGTRVVRKAAARARVLECASRAIREKGVEGASVAAIMRGAGLTHGGFYAHFASKDELVAQAITHAAETFLSELADRAAASDLAEAYLDPGHVADPGTGCAIAALGPETARAGGVVSEAIADHVAASIAMAEAVTGDRDSAIAGFATLLGGMILARAVPDGPRRAEILSACRGAAQASRSS